MRLLKANEIQAKVKAVYSSSVMLLIYKDARVDMSILDETYGAENWTCSYREVKGNLFCTISVWDKEKSTWVSKEDVGIESRTEGEKGEASDSFKRAGTKWGIGRELYTSPRIYVNINSGELTNNGKGVKTNFFVSKIGYNENREINLLEIIDQYGNVRFNFGGTATKKTTSQQSTPNTITKQQAANIWKNHDHEIINNVLVELGYKGLLEIKQSELKDFELRLVKF